MTQDVVVHECTAAFSRHVFEKYLPRYAVWRPAIDGHDVLMSPHQFAWPLFRPRLYTVLINLDTMEPPAGFDVALQRLYRKCVVDVAVLYTAPKVGRAIRFWGSPLYATLCCDVARVSCCPGGSRR